MYILWRGLVEFLREGFSYLKPFMWEDCLPTKRGPKYRPPWLIR